MAKLSRGTSHRRKLKLDALKNEAVFLRHKSTPSTNPENGETIRNDILTAGILKYSSDDTHPTSYMFTHRSHVYGVLQIPLGHFDTVVNGSDIIPIVVMKDSYVHTDRRWKRE